MLFSSRFYSVLNFVQLGILSGLDFVQSGFYSFGIFNPFRNIFHSRFCPNLEFVQFGIWSIWNFIHSGLCPVLDFVHLGFCRFPISRNSGFCLIRDFVRFGILYFEILSISGFCPFGILSVNDVLIRIDVDEKRCVVFEQHSHG